MAFKVGERRDLYRPLDQSGNWKTGMQGCHRSHMSYLNVPNPQPGRHYYWVHTSPGSIRRAKARGWNFVGKGDPEWSGSDTYQDVIAAGLDTTVTRNDIALCWMSYEKYREYQEQLAKLSENRREDVSAEYLEKGRPLQEAYGRDIYFRGSGHGFNR